VVGDENCPSVRFHTQHADAGVWNRTLADAAIGRGCRQGIWPIFEGDAESQSSRRVGASRRLFARKGARLPGDAAHDLEHFKCVDTGHN
jgi:hypothetical protein